MGRTQNCWMLNWRYIKQPLDFKRITDRWRYAERNVCQSTNTTTDYSTDPRSSWGRGLISLAVTSCHQLADVRSRPVLNTGNYLTELNTWRKLLKTFSAVLLQQVVHIVTTLTWTKTHSSWCERRLHAAGLRNKERQAHNNITTVLCCFVLNDTF